MQSLWTRAGALAALVLPAACPTGCTTCGEPQRPGTYGEESANDAMQDYEREEEMRESDL